MPTGYTADVQSGKVTEFSEFAMQCARAFGALVTMRDSPASEDVPERFEPSDYHKKALTSAHEELNKLRGMSDDEVSAARDLAEDERVASEENYRERKIAEKSRYDEMLEKVKGWKPPTPDHVEMRNFMQQQLEESIRFDCSLSSLHSEPIPSAKDWHAEKIKSALGDIKYHAEKDAEEIERTEKRNQWLSDLRSSLK